MAVQLQPTQEMFQVRRSENGGVVTFALSGRIEEEQLADLRKLLEIEARGNSAVLVLNLADVRLVHREAVKFLAECEAAGVELRSCPPYVREWIGKKERLAP